MAIAIQLLSALCGSFGFALIFRLRGKSILYATLGGMLTWGVYLIGASFGENLFLWNLVAAAFADFLLGDHGAYVQNAVNVVSCTKHYSACTGRFAVLYIALFDR